MPIHIKKGFLLLLSYIFPPTPSIIKMPIEPIIAEAERKTPLLNVHSAILFVNKD